MTWLSAGSEIAHLATSVRDPHDHYLIPNVAESTRPRSGVTDCQVIDHRSSLTAASRKGATCCGSIGALNTVFTMSWGSGTSLDQTDRILHAAYIKSPEGKTRLIHYVTDNLRARP